MKKFSTIAKVKVDQQPKQEKVKISELDELKNKLYMILDNYLSVGAYGPIHKTLLNGTLKVEGKETVIQAILDMFEETGNKRTVKLLESMKNDIRDHELLDHKIQELQEQNTKIDDSKLFNTKQRIKNLSERYSDTEEFKQVMSVKVQNMDMSLIDILEDVKIPHSRRNIIKSYLLKEEAVKYDVEAAVRDIIEFNRGNIELDNLVSSIIQNLGYANPSESNLEQVKSHLMNSRDEDTEKIPEDRTLVRELYPILNESKLNENDADEGLKVSAWIEENSPFDSEEDMVEKMVTDIGISKERAEHWSLMHSDSEKI
jgi:hypothetical protein